MGANESQMGGAEDADSNQPSGQEDLPSIWEREVRLSIYATPNIPVLILTRSLPRSHLQKAQLAKLPDQWKAIGQQSMSCCEQRPKGKNAPDPSQPNFTDKARHAPSKTIRLAYEAAWRTLAAIAQSLQSATLF